MTDGIISYISGRNKPPVTIFTCLCLCFICRTKVEVIQRSSFPASPAVFFQACGVDSDSGGELCAGSDCIQQGNTSGHQLTAHWAGCLCLSPVALPSLAPFLITWPPLLWSPLQLNNGHGSLTKARVRKGFTLNPQTLGRSLFIQNLNICSLQIQNLQYINATDCLK